MEEMITKDKTREGGENCTSLILTFSTKCLMRLQNKVKKVL